MTINSLHTQVKNNGASIHYFLDRYNNTVLGVLELGCRSLTLQLPQAAKVTQFNSRHMHSVTQYQTH